MSYIIKIILSALIAIGIISLLFFVLPVTAAFIISYIFTIVAIAGIASGICVFGKSKPAKAPQEYSLISTAVMYAVCSFIYSLIACIGDFSAVWTLIPHAAILGFFGIKTILLTAGSQYINTVEEKTQIKHAEFQKEKESYWK